MLAIVFILITGGAGAFASRRSYLTLPWRGLSITFAFLLLILAVRVYLGRFDLLFDDHTVFGGVTYTDAHVTLTGMLLVCVALVAGAVAAVANAMTVARGRWLVAAILPAALCFAGVRVAGWWMSSFIVKPNELVREQPYIAHNILMTRQAYGLDHFVAARVSRGDDRRCGRSGEQSTDAAEHPPVGLAGAAGHAAADSGNPHLL